MSMVEVKESSIKRPFLDAMFGLSLKLRHFERYWVTSIVVDLKGNLIVRATKTGLHQNSALVLDKNIF